VSYDPAAPEKYIYGTGSSTWGGATIDGFTISGNIAGGTAVNLPDSAVLRNCRIINNLGTTALSMGTATSATNVLITDNSGIGATLRTTSARLTNATIANNASYGIKCIAGANSGTISNTILWGNSNNFDAIADSSKLTIDHTALSGAPDLGGKWILFGNSNSNIDLYHRSPNFKTRKGNYELLQISPCIDTGNATNALSIDVNGMPRTYNGKMDIGALQKQSGDGIYVTGSNSFANFRASGTPALATFTGKEVLVKPGATLDLGATTTVKPKTLMLQDDNTIAAPIIKNGSFSADSILYVRPLIKKRADGVTGCSTFFGLPFTTTRLDSIDGLKTENSIRFMPYSESIRATNGPNKSAWANHMNITDMLVPGIGYAMVSSSKVPDKPVSMTVIIPAKKGSTFTDTNSTTNTLSYTSTGALAWNERGWNLIANPMAQSVAFDVTLPNWPNNPASYVWGQIYMYDALNDSYTPVPNTGTLRLSAYGACFVLTTAATTTAKFTPLLAGNTPLRVRQQSDVVATDDTTLPDIFQLHMASGTLTSDTYVMFHDSAHAEAVAMEDGPTLYGTGNTLKMYTMATGSTMPLSVNRLPFINTVMEVPLTVQLPQAGNFDFTLPESDDKTSVTLVEDDGTTHDLKSATFTLTTDAATTKNYTLRFERQKVGTGEGIDAQDSGISVYQENGTAVVTSTNPLLRVLLYGINGQIIGMTDNGGTRVILNLPGAGVYLVKATTAEKTVTKKLVFK